MFYIPAMKSFDKFKANGFSIPKSLARWQTYLTSHWDKISIDDIETPSMETSPKVGDRLPVTMKVSLGEISPDDVLVEVIAGNLNSLEQMDNYETVIASKVDGDITLAKGQFLYRTEVTCKESGRFGIAARILPRNENLISNRLPKLIKWW